MKVIPPITMSNTEGSFARSTAATYIDSTGAVVSAAANTPRVTYDPITKECLGVLYEPARTNLVAGSDTPATQNITISTGGTYTFSFYGTGTVVLSGAATTTLTGTSATTRITRVLTVNFGTLTVTITGTVTKAQLELGSFATSYIPSTQVTRSADTFTGTAPCLVYSSVANASSTTAWAPNTAYAVGDIRYRNTTNCVYQCIKTITILTGGINLTITPEASVLLSTPYWRRLDALPWVSGTTYTLVAGVSQQVTYQNRTYELLATTTVNTTLPTATSPIYWLDVGPSNRWGVFDYLRNSATVARNQIILSMSTSTRADALVLVGLQNVREAAVTVYSPSSGTTLYSSRKNLTSKASSSWYDYFFTVGTKTKSAVFSDLVPYSDAIISIVLNGSDISCGGVILGKAQEIGTVQRGASNEVINFSTVTRDIYGNATMVQRRNIPKTNQNLLLDKSLVNTVRAVRDDLNAIPAAWVGLDDLPDQFYFESLLIVGFYKTFTINLDNPLYASITLELEEI
jgi:hypothetical protein